MMEDEESGACSTRPGESAQACGPGTYARSIPGIMHRKETGSGRLAATGLLFSPRRFRAKTRVFVGSALDASVFFARALDRGVSGESADRESGEPRTATLLFENLVSTGPKQAPN